MAREDIAAPVLNFIREHIESVEQLEILLLLYHQSDRSWTADEIARELRSSPQSARKRLAVFEMRGFIRQSDASSKSFQYDPRDAGIDEGIKALAEAYQLRRVTIIDVIFSKPTEKMQTLADAFKFREDK